MKKFIIIIALAVLGFLAFDRLYYHEGVYLPLREEKAVEYFIRTEGEDIRINKGSGFESFEIRGVNLGSGIPGQWGTNFAINEETYLRWFRQIQDMGANTIRIYTVQNDTFYNAFYKYNENNPDPLYLLHGVWVSDYVINSHRDAFDKDFYDTFLENCKITVDVIHGQRKLNLGRAASMGHGNYRKDISDWVIGYIFGVDWDDSTVAYTDDLYAGVEKRCSYKGKYMYTSEDASPFETMLTMVGDKVIEHESRRYGEQRLVAFSNWPMTDPFEYPQIIVDLYKKCARVDTEHIKTTEAFIPGQFASYHVYTYYPFSMSLVDDWAAFGLESKEAFRDEAGRLNAYRAYLTMLNDHHSMPVVIAEFGLSTSRGMGQLDKDTGRNQGNCSEKQQGQELVGCWEDIKAAGSSGGCVYTWQDEWFKRTWNTMHAVNLTRAPYWSDYQSNGQYFGLLSFDPGKERSVCYVDGDVSEWTEEDVVISGECELSVKYDEKFMYFLVKKPGLDAEKEKLYIPLDITPKSGSNYCDNFGVRFDRDADFVIVIDGESNSRIMAQERYDALRSTYAKDIYGFDTYLKRNIPDRHSPKFVSIQLVLRTAVTLSPGSREDVSESYETGRLLHGNANPKSPDFNSLADFCVSGDRVEIKLPWQMMNFADPSKMLIHDDYYDGNYGVEYIRTGKIFAGVGTGEERISLGAVKLKGWGNSVSYHERLKSSYYTMQDLWKEAAANEN